MLQRKRRPILYVSTLALYVLLGISVLSGCAEIRLLTYPSSFFWLDDEDVKSTMHEMYLSIYRLNSLLEDDDTTESSSQKKVVQEEIVDELLQLESLATRISVNASDGTNSEEETSISNHFVIDENINDFVQQVFKARLRAEADPPNYYSVGKLAGQCNSCHRKRL